jgi:hypothetical protein
VRGHEPLYNSYDDVLAARTCGELQPLQLPTDPTRPKSLQYANVSITPGQMTNLGEHEITRNIARFLGFWSDALPFAYHEHEIRSVYRVEDARVVASVHALSLTGAQFPTALQAATVSGYIVMVDLTKDVGINLSMRDRDPTESIPITLEHHDSYAAMFYPDAQPVFEPVTSSDSNTEPTWRLTTNPLATNESIGSWGSKKT